MGTTESGNAAGIIEAVRKLAPEIAARADESERTRAVPAEILDGLAEAGVFRMLVPRVFGGEEVTLFDSVRVLAEVSRADASTGWNAMIGADFAIVFGRLSKDVLEKDIYADGPGAMARGAFAPKGIAVPTEGGYIVSGRWPLASGCYDFQWVMGQCIVLENGAPKMTEAGIPEMKLAVVRPDEVEFLDTWHSMGLQATGSNDFVIKDLFVPAHHTAEFMGTSEIDAPLYRLPVRLALGPTHVGVVLGIAQGALDDLRALAPVKRPAFNPMVRIAEDPVFQFRLGQLETRLAALWAYTQSECELIWNKAVAGEAVEPLDGVRQRAMVAYAHTQCIDIVNEAFAMAGSNALYTSSAIQRRWRDVRAAGQHAAASPEIYQILGALLVGEPVPPAALG